MNRTTTVVVALIAAACLSTMVYAVPEQRALAWGGGGCGFGFGCGGFFGGGFHKQVIQTIQQTNDCNGNGEYGSYHEDQNQKDKQVVCLNTAANSAGHDFGGLGSRGSLGEVAAPPGIHPNGDGILTITNWVRINEPCGRGTSAQEIKCPSYLTTGMLTTIRVLNSPITYQFRAGDPGIKTTTTFPIPVGAMYEITTAVNKRTLQYDSLPIIYSYENANIQGSPPFGEGGCTGTNSCKSQMGPNGATVVVNYHWARFP
ncbi:MAG: hypothetical protein WAM14_17265 [Candidatus Nitrosopolaris sp.]